MIKASEARQIAESTTNDKVQRALTDISSLIESSAKESKKNVEVGGIMKKLNSDQKNLVISHIQSLGYKIEDKSYSDFRESWTSWVLSW